MALLVPLINPSSLMLTFLPNVQVALSGVSVGVSGVSGSVGTSGLVVVFLNSPK